MLRLMQSELRLMLGIIPLPHQKAVLSIILRDSLEMIYHDAEVGFEFINLSFDVDFINFHIFCRV